MLICIYLYFLKPARTGKNQQGRARIGPNWFRIGPKRFPLVPIGSVIARRSEAPGGAVQRTGWPVRMDSSAARPISMALAASWALAVPGAEPCRIERPKWSRALYQPLSQL